MEDIKPIIAKNITALRQNAKLTQIELAERLNYSDKAVSKWERAESIPDVTVLKSIADMFGVPLDYLVRDNTDPAVLPEETKEPPAKKRNHKIITALSILLVWLVAALVFMVLDMVGIKNQLHFLAFAYAVPVSMIVWLVMNSIWFSRRTNYLIISLLMWTTMGCTALLLRLVAEINFWQILIPGALGQVIIITWSKMKPHQSK